MKAKTNGGERYSDEYYTPEQYHKPLGQFEFDPCAGPISSIATINNRAANGLEIEWNGRVWLNPPYSKKCKPLFLNKLAQHGMGTALVPASTDTKWFSDAVHEASSVLLITGRINFTRPGGKRSKNSGGSAYFTYGRMDAEMLENAVMRSEIKGIWVKRQEPDYHNGH